MVPSLGDSRSLGAARGRAADRLHGVGDSRRSRVGDAFAVAAFLPVREVETDLLVPVALATLMIGLIVLITRAKAITQVVGYLMLENGIYLFGLTQSERVPFLVEVGVLLDVFVGVFIMGIVVFHIDRAFDRSRRRDSPSFTTSGSSCYSSR